jgi:hypothetical protein
VRLGIEHILEPLAGEPAAALDGRLLDGRQDSPVGGPVG